MKVVGIFLVILVFTIIGCDKEYVKKPAKLLKEKQMVEIMADLHMAESTYSQMRYDSLLRNSGSVDFYYSILKKYNVADSVFEKSYIYYASRPKELEEIYRKVVNKLSEVEQKYNGRKREAVKVNQQETQ